MMRFIILLALLLSTASEPYPPTDGFISIDCGLEANTTYPDYYNDILYVADEPYTSTGVNYNISTNSERNKFKTYYDTVRSFPEGARNCYNLGPVKAGSKYRVKAEFDYGNYDGLQKPPVFDLYLGVNRWTTVHTTKFDRKEIIFVADRDSVQVCLIQTGGGTPFISELDLRPIPSSLYSAVNLVQALLVDWKRLNFGGADQIMYPEDPYDRGWDPWTGMGKPLSTNDTVDYKTTSVFVAPQAALRTAITTSSTSDNFEITALGDSSETIIVAMYFAELQPLPANAIREFNVYVNDIFAYGPFQPRFLDVFFLHNSPRGAAGGSTYALRPTANSTLPPLINAMEVLVVRQLPLLPTDRIEAAAMMELKKLYQVKKNWEGDPCLPQNLSWEGVECILDSSKYSRISALNLSQEGLTGPIPPAIANFSYLTSLDMSFGNLTGEIPAFLGQLPALKFLNLENNNLSGNIPQALLSRAKGQLVLRVHNNPILCSKENICDMVSETTGTKKKKVIVPVAVAASASVLILLVAMLILCNRRTRKTEGEQDNVKGETETEDRWLNLKSPKMDEQSELQIESHSFSSSDIVKITRNFQHPIGKGGFGTVYYGQLKNGIQVAVKVLSVLSEEGEKQFRAEALLLTRVYHKHLVSLLGYCMENRALVYEFLPLGSLSDHLSADSARSILSWGLRLRIAVEAAQGLDYLHHGCTPPIIHRDVKASNILLNENFEAKLADFGLSRSYMPTDGNSCISTVVAGTPGYIDPECFQTNRINEKNDVYSFGIVLFELATGKPPNKFTENGTHITQQVQKNLESGDIHSIPDQRMQGQYDVNSMWKFLEIATSCTSIISSERPTISDVVVLLKDCQYLQSSNDFHSQTRVESFSAASISQSAR